MAGIEAVAESRESGRGERRRGGTNTLKGGGGVCYDGRRDGDLCSVRGALGGSCLAIDVPLGMNGYITM